MLQDELPASSRGPDQVWFSMIMVNDPNAALFGSLRPSRPHPILAAMRRPFERPTPVAPVPPSDDQRPALRPRSRWIAAGLAAGLVALGFGLTETLLERLTVIDSPRAATAAPARVGSTTLTAPSLHAEPAVSRETAPFAVTVSAAGEPSAPARAEPIHSAAAPRAAERSTPIAKKKAAGRPRKTTAARTLAARKAARR